MATGPAQWLALYAGLHLPGFFVAMVPAQGFFQQVRGVHAAAAVAGALEVVAQARAEVRVRTLLDDVKRALAGRQAAQVGQALFSHHNLHIVFGVVHVGDHGHDSGNGATLGGRRGHEHRQEAVTGKVAGTADAVHDAGAHHVGGVHVTVDVGFDHAVHGNDAQAADHLRVVTDFLGTQYDAVPVEIDVVGQLLVGFRTQGESRG